MDQQEQRDYEDETYTRAETATEAGYELAEELRAKCVAAGLVVAQLDPHMCLATREIEFAICLRSGAGDFRIWAEATHESAESVQRHIDHYREVMNP